MSKLIASGADRSKGQEEQKRAGFRSVRDSSTRFLLFFTGRGFARRKDRTRKRGHTFHAKKDPLRLTRCRWHYICTTCTRTTSRKRVHPASEPRDFNWKFFHCTRRVRRVYVRRVLSWKTIRRGRVSLRRRNIDPVFLGDRGLTWMCHAIISSWCARSSAAWIFYADQRSHRARASEERVPDGKLEERTLVFRVAFERFMKRLDI